MKEIYVHKNHRSKYHDVPILVDDEDYDWLNQHRWYIQTRGHVRYARTRVDGKYIYMHKMILSVSDTNVVDHINHNGLDNQKNNLREVRRGQNNRNSRPRAGTSRYKGVSWCNTFNKWYAQISVNGSQTHIGYFTEEDDAARAYNKRALEVDPEHANLNEV